MSDRKTILVVDDIPLMRTLLIKHLKSLGLKLLEEELGVEGLKVLEAANGKEALRCLARFDVDLVFVDLMMPEMDGLTFLREKKDDPKAAALPGIVCSAVSEKRTVEKATALGALGYIVKPFTLKSIEEKFRETMTAL